MRDDLLEYYQGELTFLRRMGVEFAGKYPKIAGRLLLEHDKSEDPAVERLLEGVAFLTARVHLKIDDEFPEITEALLDILYPHYLRPVPSMSVAEFDVEAAQIKPDTGLTIKRGSILASRPVAGSPCKFRTSYDLRCWPVSVTGAEWRAPDRLNLAGRAAEAVAAIRLELRAHDTLDFSKLGLDTLRFYLTGETDLVYTLYEILDNNCTQILLRDLAPKSTLKPVVLPPGALRPVGLEADEEALPYPRRSFAGYRLLQEYFCFPQKFFFLDLSGFDRARAAGFGNRLEVLFLISRFERGDRRQSLETGITAKTFRLHCTPIVNLFPHTAEPILLHQRQHAYHIIPDVGRRTALEVFSVEEVTGVNTESEQTTLLRPLYSFRHEAVHDKSQVYWYARRRPSALANDQGTEMYLSLVNVGGQTVRPNAQVLTVRTVCTNRDLPARLPFGYEQGDFDLEEAAPVKRIIALAKPTSTVRPPLRKNLLWRLISQLSLNYLSLAEEGREALQEMLRLYNFTESVSMDRQILGIASVAGAPHFTRVAAGGRVAFARGTRIEMEFDEDQFVGGGLYLFAAVLERFFALYASTNSFTQLLARSQQRREVLRLWRPRAGWKALI